MAGLGARGLVVRGQGHDRTVKGKNEPTIKPKAGRLLGRSAQANGRMAGRGGECMVDSPVTNWNGGMFAVKSPFTLAITLLCVSRLSLVKSA